MAKRQFKAESKRLLDLMVNSIYTHKEIFLREIISNASDACDKLCYQALTDDAVGMSRKDFKIEIKVDKEHRTLTVSDNGIGMDKEDLENNLGVIASSGSYKFKQEVGDDAKDTDVIGLVRRGFYSAFMVADHITVVTRKYGTDAAGCGSPPARTATPSPNASGMPWARTSSCTSSRTPMMRSTVSSWSPGGSRSWCGSIPTTSASPSEWRSPRPAGRRQPR